MINAYTLSERNKGAVDMSLRNSPCMDCIFWYQCRRGAIDCSELVKRPGTTGV